MNPPIVLILLLSLLFGQDSTVVTRKTGNDSATINSLNLEGFRMRFTNPRQTVASATKALALAKVQNYQFGLIESHRALGIGYYYLNQPARATIEFKEALKYAVRDNDLKAQAKVYNNIGNLYFGNDNDKALWYYRKELSIFLMLRDSSGIARADLFIGDVYDKKGNALLAIKYYKESAGLFAVLKEPMTAVLASENLGLVYYKLKQFKKAESFLLAAKKEAITIDWRKSTADANLGLSAIYISQNRVTKAVEVLKEGILLSFVLKDEKIEKKFKEKLYDIQHISKDTTSITYRQISDILLYAQLNEDLMAAEKSKFEQTQSFQSATEKFVKEKQRDKSEILAKNKIIQLQYFIGGGVGVCLAILFLAGYLFYRQYRLNKALEVEKMRMNIAADFHDELGSTLSSIALYCEIAITDNFEDKQRAKTLLSSISQSSLRTVSAMKDMIWSLQSNNDSTNEVIYRMRDYAFPVADLKGINLKFDVGEDIKDLALPMNTKKNIYLIFKESINNAFKYSSARGIIISIDKKDNQLVLEIRDDGSGFDLQNSPKGYGILNMYKRAEQSGGTLKISSSPGQGTDILFCCTLT